jgi:hypothetical protein
MRTSVYIFFKIFSLYFSSLQSFEEFLAFIPKFITLKNTIVWEENCIGLFELAGIAYFSKIAT